MTARILPFPARRRATTDSAGEVIVFASLDEVEMLLRDSLNWEDPTLLIRAVCGIARMLLSDSFTEAAAGAGGWASLAAARRRGFDMLQIVASLPAARRVTR